jgi:tetratricopeptide (TPR) repeat protein
MSENDKLLQELYDAFHNKPKEVLDAESEIEMKRINKEMVDIHIKHILYANVEELIGLVQRGWVSFQFLHTVPLDFYDKGEFENCFKCLVTAEKVLSYFNEKEVISNVIKMKNIFIRYGYDLPIPTPFEKNYTQSIEDSNGSYDEHKLINGLNQDLNKSEFKQFIESIGQLMNADNYEVRANAFFISGEIQSSLGNTEESLKDYSLALSINPNKALYWGYMAQLLNFLGEYPYVSSRYCMKAIELDPMNPRWHFLQSVLLSKLVQEGDSGLLHQAQAELHKALGLCRPDQVSLKSTINGYINRE